MPNTRINPTTYQFLKDLAANNTRDWFNERKPIYQVAQQNMVDFVEAVIAEMNKHDVLETESGKKSLYRIYNDVRFSKDKSPYNPRFAFSMRRATKYRRGGYYMNVQPGNSFLACGFFNPNPEDLKRIRLDIDANDEELRSILASKEIQKTFGGMRGSQVATAPRGFEKDHPAIDLIRYKQFTFRHDFMEREVLSPDFVLEVSQTFAAIRPFFDYMSDVLTTNLNGERVV